MADNKTLPPTGTGTADIVVATDEIAGVDYQKVKLVDGTADATTVIAAGGGVEAGALRVTIANDSTGLVSVDDNGGSLTVDGTVAVTQSGTWDEVGINDSGNSITVDATDGTVFVRSSASGTFPVSVPASATNFTKAEDAASANADVGVANLAVRKATPANTSDTDGDYEMLQMSAGRLWTSATIDAAIPAGTNAIGKLAANSGVDIGDVDVTSIAAGDNNIGNVDIVTMPNVTLAAGTNTNEVVGDVAHGSAAAGNPVLTGGFAEAMADSAPGNRTNMAASDVGRYVTDLDGVQFVHPFGPQIWSYHENSSSALTDTTVHSAPGAGLSLYVTDIVCSTGAATALNVFFEESTTTTVLGPYYLEAVAGRGFAIHFNTPKKITANTSFTVTTSAAIAHSIDVTGFVAPG